MEDVEKIENILRAVQRGALEVSVALEKITGNTSVSVLEKEISKEKMAEMLNERIYGNEITKEEEALAKKNGLVVVFGASDDLMEMRGAIDDEFGTEVMFDETGEVMEDCSDNCKSFQKAIEKAKKIKGNFGRSGWTFEAEVPFAEFDIFENGELYGKGIVFDIESLKK